MSHKVPTDSGDYRSKVEAIFREIVGEKAEQIDGSRYNHESAALIDRALRLTSEGGSSPDDDTARDIAFHLTDWASDAAFLVALHLFPERFTAAEVAEGVEAVLCHVPNHVAAAAALHGYPVEDIFGVRTPDSNLTERE